MTDVKVCKICKELKLLANFSNNSLARDGKDARCKPCDVKRVRDRNKPEAIAEREKLIAFKLSNPDLKRCPDCKTYKSKAEFYSTKYSIRLASICKMCSNKRSRTAYKKDKEKMAASSRARYLKNRQQRIEYARKYRQEKADQVRLVNKRWRENNRDKESSYTSRKRARKRSGIWEYYDRQFVFDRDNGICCICFVPIDITLKCPDKMSFTVQHLMPLSLGGSDILDNVAPAHFSCNSRIGNRKIMTRAN